MAPGPPFSLSPAQQAETEVRTFSRADLFVREAPAAVSVGAGEGVSKSVPVGVLTGAKGGWLPPLHASTSGMAASAASSTHLTTSVTNPDMFSLSSRSLHLNYAQTMPSYRFVWRCTNAWTPVRCPLVW